jgi:hypothetical protein
VKDEEVIVSEGRVVVEFGFSVDNFVFFQQFQKKKNKVSIFAFFCVEKKNLFFLDFFNIKNIKKSTKQKPTNEA